MKIRSLILLIAICFGCRHAAKITVNQTGSPVHRHSEKPGLHFNDLTNDDRAKYVLTVKFIATGSDTCRHPAMPSYKLKVNLQNLSGDTLKYLDYTCSHMIWRTDNDSVWTDQRASFCLVCTANFMTAFEVAPHSSKEFELTSEFRNDPTKFRVGMILQRIISEKDWARSLKYFDSNNIGALQKQTQNTIWSNYVQIPN